MHQGAKRSARHATQSHLIGDAIPQLLQEAFCPQGSHLREAEQGIEGQASLHKPTHGGGSLLRIQATRHHIACVRLDPEFTQRIPISLRTGNRITHMFWPCQMDDASPTLANQRFHQQERHDIVIHDHPGGLHPLHRTVEEGDGNPLANHPLIALDVRLVVAYTHQDAIHPALLKHPQVLLLLRRILVRDSDDHSVAILP